MPYPGQAGAAALAFLLLTGAATAMPLGLPGSPSDVARADAGVQPASWWCFQYGNCVWRPDAYSAPYPAYRHRYTPRARYYGYYGPRGRRW
jgi:hypothetical protein